MNVPEFLFIRRPETDASCRSSDRQHAGMLLCLFKFLFAHLSSEYGGEMRRERSSSCVWHRLTALSLFVSPSLTLLSVQKHFIPLVCLLIKGEIYEKKRRGRPAPILTWSTHIHSCSVSSPWCVFTVLLNVPKFTVRTTIPRFGTWPVWKTLLVYLVKRKNSVGVGI